jgi:hypothetical protein
MIACPHTPFLMAHGLELLPLDQCPLRVIQPMMSKQTHDVQVMSLAWTTHDVKQVTSLGCQSRLVTETRSFLLVFSVSFSDLTERKLSKDLPQKWHWWL